MRTGSFRSAAREVYLSQPSVSTHIAKLERELGLTLFERGSDGTRLTEDGERMVPHLRAFTASAAAIRQASAHIQTNSQQSLTVYSYRTGLLNILPNAVRTLHEAFSPMNITLVEATHEQMVAALLQGRCDLALDARLDAGLADPVGIDATVLVDLGPPVLIGRRGHPLLEQDGWIDPSEIGDVPIVVPTSLAPFIQPLLSAPASRDLIVAHDVAGAMALFEAGAVLAIIGIGPRVVRDPDIVRRPIAGSPHMLSMVMTASGAALSPPARALHDYLLSWAEHWQQNMIVDRERGLWSLKNESSNFDPNRD